MEEIRMFRASDGTLFSAKEECAGYEKIATEIDRIMSVLPKEPRDGKCHFANGGGYIQLDWRDLKYVVVNLAYTYLQQNPDSRWHDMLSGTPTELWRHRQAIARSMQDSQFYSPWYRLMCVDENYRQWGQPYYASNPGTGDNCEYTE